MKILFNVCEIPLRINREEGIVCSLSGQVDLKVILFISKIYCQVTVGIIAVPLAMSFAIASGVSPEYGIYTDYCRV